MVGCTTEVFGGHTYQFCNGAVPWETAATQCRGWGYHLVHVEDAAENAWITMTARDRGLGGGTGPAEHLCAIGLRQDLTSMAFQWTDGTLATFTPWDADEPNASGPCVRIRNATGVWADGRCTVTAYDFVCETP
jgi:hypothetical protein